MTTEEINGRIARFMTVAKDWERDGEPSIAAKTELIEDGIALLGGLFMNMARIADALGQIEMNSRPGRPDNG